MEDLELTREHQGSEKHEARNGCRVVSSSEGLRARFAPRCHGMDVARSQPGDLSCLCGLATLE